MTPIEAVSEFLANAPDLAEFKRAVVREEVIRQTMAQSGESRKDIAELIDAMESVNEETVLELTDGHPTTLADALSRYVDDLERRWPEGADLDHDTVVGDLHALLTFPYSEEEALVALHGDNHQLKLEVRHPDDETMEVWIGGQFLYGANHDDHAFASMSALETAAKTVHRAVLARVVADRPHHVRLTSADRRILLSWLGSPEGTWEPDGGSRFNVTADGTGLIVRTWPYVRLTAPATEV